jgi:hypothetical protein
MLKVNDEVRITPPKSATAFYAGFNGFTGRIAGEVVNVITQQPIEVLKDGTPRYLKVNIGAKDNPTIINVDRSWLTKILTKTSRTSKTRTSSKGKSTASASTTATKRKSTVASTGDLPAGQWIEGLWVTGSQIGKRRSSQSSAATAGVKRSAPRGRQPSSRKQPASPAVSQQASMKDD